MKRGTAKGLWKGGKDFAVGVYDTFAYPEETLEAMYYAGRYPKETASAAKEQITKAYEHDMIKGGAVKRSEFVSNTNVTLATSVFGDKGFLKATRIRKLKPKGMPPIVQSRVNLRNGSAAEGAGFNHVLDRHFNPSKNASQFSIIPDDLKGILQSQEVVNTPVSRVLYSDIKLADGTVEKQARYVREVTLDSNIGIDKFSGSPTNIMTVLTDKYGNLVTTTPGVIK